MRVVLLEDEQPAREHLERAARRADPQVEIVACFASVEKATSWLLANPAPDLVLADIELADGVSLAVFDRVPLRCPVIFCTAYDEYLVEAMERNGIDYLLKPIRTERLAAAIAKYRRFEAHFGDRLRALGEALGQDRVPTRQRLLVRHRDGFASLQIENIAYFEVHDGVLTVVGYDGRRFMCDRSLGELEAELDPSAFFRVNRQYLVGARAIVGVSRLGKGKLLVEARPPPSNEIVCSQENAARFRAWLGG